MIALWWVVMRKILRISKQNRITSLADFIASRYGKSALLGGVVTVIAVIGILPYISLQLKAVSSSFTIRAAVSRDRHAGEGRRGAAARRHRALGGADPRRVHHRSSARATSTPPSTTRAWWPRSPSSRW